MKSNALILTILLTALTGCASTYAPGSPQALNAEMRRNLMNECMSAQTENIMEMASIDPTYVARKCRQNVDARLRYTAAGR